MSKANVITIEHFEVKKRISKTSKEFSG